jgi:prepilin-type N-terminal cleavage/methylation domain-containing protein
MKNKGFTLIELLVVIGIIAILSAVILAVLGDARTRGSDAAVKSNLDNIRAPADIYYDANSGSYGTFSSATCPTSATTGNVFSVQSIVNAIGAAVSAGGGSTSVCVATGNSYAIAVGLKTSGQSWCIDNSGKSRQFAGTPSAAITSAACN